MAVGLQDEPTGSLATFRGAESKNMIELQTDSNVVDDEAGITFRSGFEKARIYAINKNTGNTDGHLVFEVTATERMRIASSTNITLGLPLQLKSYTVGTVPSASTIGNIRVSDETGGSVPAYSDGTNWRRYSDGAIVS